MKSILVAFLVAVALASCDSNEVQSQRCKGILLDSLTNLSKFRDRVTCLEAGACGIMKEYQWRVDSLENVIDSITKVGRKYRMLYTTKATTHKSKSRNSYIPDNKSVPQPADADTKEASAKETSPKEPFYYDYTAQKYYFYDRKTGQYYTFDPVTREKHYK